MSKLDEALGTVVEKLDSIATQYSPDVADAALKSVQISAYNTILVSCFFIMVGIVMGIATYHIGKRIWERRDEWREWEVGAIATTIWSVGGVLSITTITIHLLSLVDLWLWVAITDPRLAIAHKALGL